MSDMTSRLLRASANNDAPTVRMLLRDRHANANLIVPFQRALSGRGTFSRRFNDETQIKSKSNQIQIKSNQITK